MLAHLTPLPKQNLNRQKWRFLLMAKEQVSDKKTCFKCGRAKNLTDFYKHPQMGDGRLNKCKECTKKDVQQNYRANIDYYKQYEVGRANLPHRVQAREEYAQTEAGKISGNRAKRKWVKNNPEKRNAQTQLSNAVRDGRVKKQPCCICKSTRRIHGHHEDYSKPFDVVWLCPKHHIQWHKNEITELASIPF
jgi:hypothetical protein